MRHRPQQERSRQTVDLILDTAADLLAEVGYESATTNAIAERAGISIGSLYRYFPDKDAILHALARRHQEQVRAIFDRAFTDDAIYLPLSVLLDRIIDPFLELHTVCPAYQHILLGADVSADMATANEELDREIVERLAAILQLTVPRVDAQQAHLIALVCKAQVKALLSLAASSNDDEVRSEVIAEAKRALIAYLEPIFREE